VARAEGEGRRAMTEWANYNANGKRLPPKRAVFRAKEVSVGTGVPAPPGRAVGLTSGPKPLRWGNAGCQSC
jgi:hypothetical protein